MFLRDWKTKKIYGVELGKQGGDWFYFRLQFDNPSFLYLFLKFLPLPWIKFYHTSTGEPTDDGSHHYNGLWKWYGYYYLQGLALRLFISKKPIIELDILGFLPISTRTSVTTSGEFSVPN